MSKSRRILVISQYFYPESFRINDIASTLVSMGWNVDVLTGIPNYPNGKYYEGYKFYSPKDEQYNGVRILRTPIITRGKTRVQLVLNYLSFVVSGKIKLRSLKDLHYDFVFFYEVSPMIQGLVAITAKKLFKVKLVSNLLDLWPENYTTITGDRNSFVVRLMSSITRRIVDASDIILVPSDGFKHQISLKYHRTQNLLSWPQYAEDYYRSFPKRPTDGHLKIVFTGNVGKAQNLRLLIDALESSNDLNQGISFTIIGNGSQKEELIKHVEHKQLSFITFMDAVDPENISELLADYDIGFLSIQQSITADITIPAKFQSYLASGIPVLGIIGGETASLIKKHNLGWVETTYEQSNIIRLLRQIKSISREGLSEYAQRCVKFSEENYNKQQLMNELNSILLENL